MKFKKAFAWILAVAMVITLMPSMAFASTTNRVLTVPTVATDDNFGSNVIISMENTSGIDINDQTIRLTLENATFEQSDGTSLEDEGVSHIGDYIKVSKNANDFDTVGNNKAIVTAESVSDTSARINIKFTSDGTNVGTDGPGVGDGTYMYLMIPADHIRSGSDAGEVRLIIDSVDSMITGNSYTIATASGGRTVAEVTGTTSTVSRGEIISKARIEIMETNVIALGNTTTEVIKLTLPKDCEWKAVSVSGSMIVTPVRLTSPTNWVDGTTTQGLYVDSSNKRIAYLVVTTNGLDPAKRDSLVIAPEYIIGKDTPAGDITVDIEGRTGVGGSAKAISDASGLVINVYGEENVEVSTVAEADLPTIVAGKVQNNKDKDFTVKVTLKENMKGALEPGRYVDFDFPEEIQIKGTATDMKYVVSKNTSASTAKFANDTYIDVEQSNGPTGKDASGFSFLVPSNAGDISSWSTTAANTITFEIPVTVEAGYEGDIACTVSGAKAGVDETSLIVGKAIAPISITANTTEIRTGVQSQAVADITITENIAGYLSDKTNFDELHVGIDSLGLLSGMSIAKFDKAEVTAGNLEIGKVDIEKNSICDIDAVGGSFINIPIDSSSTTASTIVISGVTVNLNRTLPEGGYTLLTGGDAIVDNTSYNNERFSDEAASLADYVKIVTPADPTTISGQLINAVFTLRQDTFINNGETVQMDTAPYLDANNRTQLPIRYAAIACGVPESDISWNQATQTATINAGSKVLRITIGSNIMQTSDGNVVMDTAAVSSNGRIFVPIRYIANALGANVAWDQEAKTITLTN